MKDLFGNELIATVAPDGEKGQEERGAFYTPQALADAICRTLKHDLHIGPSSIFEPGCGGGAFLRAAIATWPDASLLGVDLVPACEGPGMVLQQDLFRVKGPFDLVLGNPDFGIAEAAVRHGLSTLAPGGHLAFLLLASFEEADKRVPLYRSFPLWARQMIAQRASFTNDGQTDQRAYALFVWEQGFRGDSYRGLRPLVWR